MKEIELPFSKYTGCGNDFLLFDARETSFPWLDPSKLCNRRYGIGADGLILLQNSSIATYKMTCFNADGTEAEMCGNGIRCLAAFARDLGDLRDEITVETLAGVLTLTHPPQGIRVVMPPPLDIRWNRAISLNGNSLTAHFLNTGVPHAIFFHDSLATVDVAQEGALLRRHAAFAPEGANINFVALSGDSTLNIRTYERGVEAETLACGTGATAAALAAGMLYQLSAPIEVVTASGESLFIDFSSKEGQFQEVTMTGAVQFLFRGFVLGEEITTEPQESSEEKMSSLTS